MARAKQTFLNAGYTEQEIQEATQMTNARPIPTKKPLSPEKQPQKIQTKPKSKKRIIIISIIVATVLIIALLLGLFWKF